MWGLWKSACLVPFKVGSMLLLSTWHVGIWKSAILYPASLWKRTHAYTVPAALRWGLLGRATVLMFMWWRKRKWLVASRLGWAGLGKDFFGAKFLSNLVLGWGCLQEVVFWF